LGLGLGFGLGLEPHEQGLVRGWSSGLGFGLGLGLGFGLGLEPHERGLVRGWSSGLGFGLGLGLGFGLGLELDEQRLGQLGIHLGVGLARLRPSLCVLAQRGDEVLQAQPAQLGLVRVRVRGRG